MINSNFENGIDKPATTVFLSLALILSLLPKSNRQVKLNLTIAITLIWLIYSIYHKDYIVMVVCIIILFNIKFYF
jgi:hypothetical protein